MKHKNYGCSLLVTATLVAATACGGSSPPVETAPPQRVARLEFARRVPVGQRAVIFDENVCVTAKVECTGPHDHGSQFDLQIPGAPCETQRPDGRTWVRARGAVNVPWPCRGAGEVWVSGLLPDVGCRHPHERYAASSEHDGELSATVELECPPERH